MPKNGKQMVRYLKKHGFVVIGYKGSHCKLYNKNTDKYTEVPIHSKELKRSVELAILKQADLKGDEK